MTGERDRAIQVSLSWCLAGLVSLTKFWNRENEDQRCIICNSIFCIGLLCCGLESKNRRVSKSAHANIVKKKNRAQLKLFLLIIIILWRKIYLDDVLKSNEARYWRCWPYHLTTVPYYIVHCIVYLFFNIYFSLVIYVGSPYSLCYFILSSSDAALFFGLAKMNCLPLCSVDFGHESIVLLVVLMLHRPWSNLNMYRNWTVYLFLSLNKKKTKKKKNRFENKSFPCYRDFQFDLLAGPVL